MTMIGSVAKKLVFIGSKSEHEAIVLTTPGKDYILRRRGKSAYVDSVLNGLVGKLLRLECEVIKPNTALIDSWFVLA